MQPFIPYIQGIFVTSLDKKTHWQNVYRRKESTEVSWFQTRPALSLELIANCGADTSAAIIDIGGGASLLVDHLLVRGHTDVTVLDISAAALQKSKHRLGTAAAKVCWIESDITHFSPDRQYAVWHDRAVFHFLTEVEDRQHYVDTLKNALAAGGHLVLAAFSLDGPEQCSGLPIVQYNTAKLLGELGPDFRLVEEVAEEHLTPAQQVQKFAYFRILYAGGK